MVARQPYVKFSFKGGKAGDTVTAQWTDNKHTVDSTKTQIKAD
jgi:sulfur-oxidizing protein SoxZ